MLISHTRSTIHLFVGRYYQLDSLKECMYICLTLCLQIAGYVLGIFRISRRNNSQSLATVNFSQKEILADRNQSEEKKATELSTASLLCLTTRNL